MAPLAQMISQVTGTTRVGRSANEHMTNGCYQRIYGVRHLCMFCHYDLCGECKSKGLHSEHDMATIDMNHLFDSLREHIGEIYIE